MSAPPPNYVLQPTPTGAAEHERWASQNTQLIRKDGTMTLFTLETADIVHVVDPHYSEVWHINLERVAYLNEIRRKPTPNNPRLADSWHVRVDGMNVDVTEAAFKRLQRAMSEST